MPVVADFLTAAQQEFSFAPRLPQSEIEFKRVYAKVALAAGLTQRSDRANLQLRGDRQRQLRRRGRARIQQARPRDHHCAWLQPVARDQFGGNPGRKGRKFINELEVKLAEYPALRTALDGKIEVLRKMVAFARSVPDEWNQHEILANTREGHRASTRSISISMLGRILQTQKLLDFGRLRAPQRRVSRTLTAAELEMMNLTGDGNGFDMVTMPHVNGANRCRQRISFGASGYFDNPVAQRNNVVAKLIAATDARMDEETKKPGARDLAAAIALVELHRTNIGR